LSLVIVFKNTITDLFRGIYTEFLTGSVANSVVFQLRSFAT
jgi:hypothetical protein